MKPLSFLADENIPGLKELLDSYSVSGGWQYTLRRKPGREILSQDLVGIDALLIRSVTQVNRNLLGIDAHSQNERINLRFLGTCTIGVDHVDQSLLKSENIQFASAPGCNADAVVDYVLAAALAHASNLSTLKTKTFSVLGYGQVGSRLCRRLCQLGVHTKVFDPFVRVEVEHHGFKSKLEQCEHYDHILDADIISIHTPLTQADQSSYPTHQLFQHDDLKRLHSGVLLINAARGSIVDNEALLDHIRSHGLVSVLDVYQHEPQPAVDLLEALFISTGHIAGYSEQGKLRGTQMVVEALLESLGKLSKVESTDLLSPTAIRVSLNDVIPGPLSSLSADQQVQAVIDYFYPIKNESKDFIQTYQYGCGDAPQNRFDSYRKNYQARKEWQFVTLIDTEQLLDSTVQDLLALGFKVEADL